MFDYHPYVNCTIRLHCEVEHALAVLGICKSLSFLEITHLTPILTLSLLNPPTNKKTLKLSHYKEGFLPRRRTNPVVLLFGAEASRMTDFTSTNIRAIYYKKEKRMPL